MLDGVRILACGTRGAVNMCAALLERAGARVATADDSGGIPPFHAYDAVIASSDTAPRALADALAHVKATAGTIVCDITATGPNASRVGVAYSDAQIQAMTGLMDTTGFADGPPVKIGVPFAEISAGMYAASALVAALGVRRTRGLVQAVDVTLFGCAAGALTTFLPKAFAQRDGARPAGAGRVGNRHPACAPWNAYPTRDGWVLICTSTEEQWRKLRDAIGGDALLDPRFDSLASRLQHVDELDAHIAAWSGSLSTAACSATCERGGIAAGPIVSLRGLADEPNFRLRHAGTARALEDAPPAPGTYRTMAPFRVFPLASGVEAPKRAAPSGAVEPGAGPLAGMRVIEIGQYTTAPLAGKHLAALGAEVIKIEPPGGEVARTWTPGQGGLSYFFALNNTDKRTIALDLKRSADRARFEELVRTADVLVENLRPGALGKLGFDRAALAALNPHLAYCSISGFGLDSAYPSRPAFDTVIQAMGGLMDLTRSGDAPVKIGASAADILGGQAALFAILVSLTGALTGVHERRAGVFIEISMQDVAAWCALYAAGNPPAPGAVIACADGHVWLEDPRAAPDETRQLARRARCALSTRARAVESLGRLGVRAVAVARVDELMEDADFVTDILSVGRGADGAFWPVLKVPYRLARTPAVVRTVPGKPSHGEAGDPAPSFRAAARDVVD